MRGVFLYTIQFGNIVPFYMLNLFLLPKTEAWCILLVAVSLNFFFNVLKKSTHIMYNLTFIGNLHTIVSSCLTIIMI